MRYSFLLLALLCSACGTALPTIKPYKLEVQQGNVVTSKMLLQLRPGMTKSQVRFIMGTPLIIDSFHDKRWDYVYQLRENGKIKEQRRVILDFDNELLKSVRGDVTPSKAEQNTADKAPVDTGTRVVKPSAKPEGKSFLNKLKFWQKDEVTLPEESAAKQALDTKARLDAEKARQEEVTRANLANKKNSEIDKNLKIESSPPSEDASTEKPLTPMDEPKSILSVPLEILPVEPAAPVQVKPAPSPLKVRPAEIAPVKPTVKPAPTNVTPVQKPANALPLESATGLPDKNLHRQEVIPQDITPETAPRAGNKTVPQPKDLPEEGSPGFFDSLLEKIGF